MRLWLLWELWRMWMDLWERPKSTPDWLKMFHFASCASANALDPSGSSSPSSSSTNPRTLTNSWTCSNPWTLSSPRAKSEFAGRWLLFMGWS